MELELHRFDFKEKEGSGSEKNKERRGSGEYLYPSAGHKRSSTCPILLSGFGCLSSSPPPYSERRLSF
jgi:hypothetical protein